MRQAWQQGLSLLEFTLVVTVFSVLMVFAVDRIAGLRADLERAAVEHTLAGMRSALALKFAELVAQGEHDRIEAWEGGNALELVRGRRALTQDEEPTPGPGRWRYDPDDGEIVYDPAYPEALTGDAAGVGRWRVTVIGNSEPHGLVLEAVEPLDLDGER